MGDGLSLNICDAKWIPQPNSFKIIMPKKARDFFASYGRLN